MDDIAVLVLAAGKSSRMKNIKQLIKIDYKFLLEITLEKAKKIAPKNTYCVLGANAEKIKNKVDFNNIQIIINKGFEEGLSSSIIQSIKFFKNVPLNLKGVLILLADQPAIHQSYLEEMVHLFKEKPVKIIASKYNQTYGVPALIPSIYFDDLLKIKGDKGAKTFLENNMHNIISTLSKTNLIDIDTQRDLNFYTNQLK
ncbi:nucleotidyltransferase family protein [Polaribacter porphyrae]|uniref:Glycosyl transferase n=1 Tax=Polaribacter porphyrae TaxID=1137780 RepID=A0A2S7WQJ4_9FLAO|nr:nucleotidyltransferase family protein [Polaribacter porphyrae]PQJ79582.1 glycosyl transferase [Polaribacter porphyrae]